MVLMGGWWANHNLSTKMVHSFVSAIESKDSLVGIERKEKRIWNCLPPTSSTGVLSALMSNVSALWTPWKEVALPVPNIIVTCLGRAEGKMGVRGWLLHAVFFFWGSQVVPEAELLLRKTPRRKDSYSHNVLAFLGDPGLHLVPCCGFTWFLLNLVLEGHTENWK